MKICQILTWVLVSLVVLFAEPAVVSASSDISVEYEINRAIAVKFSKLQCPTLRNFSLADIDLVIGKAFPDGLFAQKWFEHLKSSILAIDAGVDIQLTPPKGMLFLPREYAHFTVQKDGKERNYILVHFPGNSGVLCEELD